VVLRVALVFLTHWLSPFPPFSPQDLSSCVVVGPMMLGLLGGCRLSVDHDKYILLSMMH
jgi:hypothetical protein